MITYPGKTVFPGAAFGTIALLEKPTLEIDESPAPDAAAEKAAFRAAIENADAQLEALFEKTRAEVGEEEAAIVDVQRMMLQDEDLIEAVEALIDGEQCRAASAVSRAGKQFFDMFSNLDDPYMKARAPDIADVSRRLTALLLGVKTDFALGGPSIIIADDLSPSDTLSLDKKLIRAFVTRRGTTNSHAAILARILKIPSLVQTEFPVKKEFDGKEGAVDGHKGFFYIEPDAETRAALEKQQEKDRAEESELLKLVGKPTVTKSGKKIELAANIGNVEDLGAALANDAEGIGLFRSEFLYLGRTNYPGEEEQFAAYRAAAEKMQGKRVVIRTLDIGADKQADYLDLETEENPALGLRAIRLCFDRLEMFRIQLRALYRASAYGTIAIMFPMIASMWELKRCKSLAAEIRAELDAKKIKYGKVELGMMVETPAAAILADEFAKEADFFSVGTNDLTQYTLACDRQNAKLEPFADPHHPALLRLLENIVQAAHAEGKWAGICGELAADPAMTEHFVRWGYDELSMSPGFILGMRKRIREMNI